MTKLLPGWILAALVLLAGLARGAGALDDPLRVVTTLPDLADIVREIGGERVSVTSICKGRENLHAVSAKPSHMVALSKADLFFEIGLSLEIGFVPGLLENCGNSKLKPGGAGFVNVSEGWQALAVPTSLSRQAGDVHPQGNPHLNLDPRAGQWIADKVLAALVANEPKSKAAFEARHADYSKRLDAARARWDKLAAGWKGAKFVEYHQEYEYIAAFYGMEIAGKIESKPGIPPTPNHIAELVSSMKQNGVKLIVSAPWSSGRDVEQLAKQTGAKAIELPNQCGGLPGTESWIKMMDVMHERLAAGLGSGTKP